MVLESFQGANRIVDAFQLTVQVLQFLLVGHMMTPRMISFA
jgi:hypothetical protein